MKHLNLKTPLTLLVSILLAVSAHVQALDFGEWTSNVKQAKTLALQTNRPIFVVANSFNCTHCDNLNDRALETDVFKAFARKNQIVLFRTDDSLIELSMAITNTYASLCHYGSVSPHIFLFHVKSTANLNNTSSTAFSKSEVDLAKVTWATSETPYCGKQFLSSTTVFGIPLGREDYWNSTIVGNLLAKFFPNDYWNSPLQYPDITNMDKEDENYDPDAQPDDPDDPVTPDPTPTPISGDWQDLDKWDGIWVTNVANAKKYALENNRPLFAVINAYNCTHCDNLKYNALETSEFLKFASDNKIVLFKTTDQSLSLANHVVDKYASTCHYNSVSPHLFLFKVKDGANVTSTSDTALDPSQVDLVQVTWSTSEIPYCGKNFVASTSIFGVRIGAESSWSAPLVENVIQKFFPNTGWDTITPEATGPGGYEDAVAMPRIPNQSNPPGTSGYSDKWYSYVSSINLAKGTSVQTWFTFRGDGGKRYWFNTHVLPTAAAGTGTYSMTAEIYAASGDKPATSPLYTLQSNNLENFSKGFVFDAPSNSGIGKTFYLRLIGTSSSSSSKLPVFDLQVHETTSSPSIGSVTNPRWSGAAKGTWTMDLDKAMELACKTNTPLLIYFSGVAWCPHCINMEHNTFSQSSFTSALSNYYAVVLENQRRSPAGDTEYPGYGPSLLVDDSSKGYLTANSLSASEGQAKLQANMNVQKSLLLPGKTKIGYPTLMLCRVTQQGSSYNLDPVGRFGEDDGDTAAKALAMLQRLTTLYQAGYSESAAYPEHSSLELDTSGNSQSIPVSDFAVTWLRFTLFAGETVEVTGSASPVQKGATITYSILDNDYIPLMTTESMDLSQPSSFRFTWPENETKELWLKVTTTGQTDVTTLSLTATSSIIVSELKIPDSKIIVNRREKMVQIPLSLVVHHPEFLDDTPVSFYYRVMPAKAGQSDQPAPENYFDGTVWKEYIWDDLSQTTMTIPVGIHVPQGEEAWDDTVDFVIAFQDGGTPTCTIPENAYAIVGITTYPVFLECATEYNLFVGLNTVLDFPICPSDYMKVATVSPSKLPAGMTFVDNSNDPDNPRLTIKGTPTEATSKKVNLGLIYNDGDNLNSTNLSVTLNVSEIDNDLISKKAFSGVFRTANEVGIAGSLFIMKEPEGTLAITVSTGQAPQPLTTRVSSWQYDSDTQALTADTTFDNGSTLRISISQDVRSAVFTSAQGTLFQCSDLQPVTATPEQYAGMYNVALRQYNDLVGLSEGWIHMNIDADGIVSMKIMTYVHETVYDFTTCVTDGASDGVLSFFVPYFSQGNYFSKVCGVMNIVPKSARSSQEILSWVSACSDNDCLFAYDDAVVLLKICGTVFDSSKTITECLGQSQATLVLEIPNTEEALVSHIVPMEETEKFVFTPQEDDRILTSADNQMIINEADGTFTMPAFVLQRKKNQSSLTKVPVEIKGIVIPTSLDCCGADSNIAIAYGYYRYPAQNGNIYRVYFRPTYPHTSMPTPTLSIDTLEDGVIYADYSVKTTDPEYDDDDLTDQAIILCNSNNQYYAFTNGQILLPGTGNWLVTALDKNALYSESSITPLGGIVEVTYGTTMQEGEIPLTPGWNLIGIPYGLTIMPETTMLDKNGKPASLMTLDAASNCYVFANEIQSGNAYWLFARSGDSFHFSALEIASSNTTSDFIPNGWSMKAYSRKLDVSSIFKYVKGKFLPVTDADTLDDTQGVLIYK